MTTTHDFHTSLARSQGYDELAAECMARYFGNAFAGYAKNDDIELDKRGVDAIVTLTNGKRLYLDLKVDHYDTDQFTLELWSNTERGKLGWTCDNTKLTDLVVYIKAARNTTYVFPFLQLQHFMRQQCALEPQRLMQRMKVVRNTNYSTTIVLYRTQELLSALGSVVLV